MGSSRMSRFPALLIAGMACIGAFSRAAEAGCVPPTEAEVAGLFDRWSASLVTLHPDRVLKNYAGAAQIFPLASRTERRGEAEIRDYYVYFLQRQPRARVEERVVRAGCVVASDSGTYALTLQARQGKAVETLRVRYSFLYEKRDGEWRIVHEHASLGPEKGPPDRVPLVNADPLAADTGRPKAVAGYLKRTSAKRKPAVEPAGAASAVLQWRAMVPESEQR